MNASTCWAIYIKAMTVHVASEESARMRRQIFLVHSGVTIR
jgi:hypothetical protein